MDIYSTRREFLKTVGGVSLLAMAHPLISSCGNSDNLSDYSQTIGEMTSYIENTMAADQVTGAAIALVDDQRVVWARGFGYADAANQLPVTADTTFGIGSTSKTFSAAMIMKLVDDGLVHLDDPVTKYIPAFSMGAPLDPSVPPANPITIRMILDQHSGIPGEMGNGLFTQTPHPEICTQNISYLQGDHAQLPTDYMFAYSNTAVGLLGDVIASASQVSFFDYSNAFLRSLGMNRSSFDRDDPSVAVGQTKTYYQGQPAFDGYINTPATGGMISSISDMARYMKMILAGGVANGMRVLKPESFGAMLSRQNGSVPLDFDFSIGYIWWLCDFDLSHAGRICQHGGTTTMTKTSLKILLDHKLGAIILTNSDTASPLRNTAVTKMLELALEEKTGIRSTYAPVSSDIVSWSAGSLDALAGVYIASSTTGADPAGVKAGKGYDLISRSATGLTWVQDAGADAPVSQALVPRANGRFSAPDSQETEYQFLNVSGRDVMIMYYKGQRTLKSVRFTPVPIPAAWSARVGTWRIANLHPDEIQRIYPGFSESLYDTTLSSKDGMLLMAGLPLVPVTDTQAYRAGLARDLGVAVQILTVAGEEIMQSVGYRFKKV